MFWEFLSICQVTKGFAQSCTYQLGSTCTLCEADQNVTSLHKAQCQGRPVRSAFAGETQNLVLHLKCKECEGKRWTYSEALATVALIGYFVQLVVGNQKYPNATLHGRPQAYQAADESDMQKRRPAHWLQI